MINNGVCPSCGNELIYSNGMQKCKVCKYQCEVNTIDYTYHPNNICMICYNLLTNEELQICNKCKEKIMERWRRQND